MYSLDRQGHAALPYAAIAIGLAFGDPWQRWHRTWRAETIAVATVWALLGAGLFWGTFAPTAAATKALLLSYGQLQQNGGHYRVGGPSEFALRLAHYPCLPTMSIRSWMSTTIL